MCASQTEVMQTKHANVDEAWAEIGDDDGKVAAAINFGEPLQLTEEQLKLLNEADAIEKEVINKVIADARSLDDLERAIFEALQTDERLMQLEDIYRRQREAVVYVVMNRRDVKLGKGGIFAVFGELGESIPEEKRPCYRVFENRVLVKEFGNVGPGLYRFDKKNDKSVRITTCPIYITAHVVGNGDDNNYARLLKFRTTDGKWKHWVMPMAMLFGSPQELCSTLAARGFVIVPKQKDAFIEYLATQTVRNDRICTSQVGWCRNAFALPDATYGPGSKAIVFQEGETGKGDYECGGKYEDWKNGIAAVAIGNPMLAFALSAAFVGPLLKLCGAESGGIHFDGDSSTGKTTLLRAAASVWGFPRRYIRTWNTTAAGLEGVAELYNDNLLPLDEIGQCSPEAIGSVIYSLMNEGGKQRANQKGDARKRKEWRTFIMSNGERSAATIMGVAKQKIKAGQEVRLVNIPVKRRCGAWDDLHGLMGDTAGAAFSDAIRKAAESNYGHAGRAFLEKLVEDKRDWPHALAQYRATEELGAQSGDGQDQRVAARFALIALAGEVATEYGVLPWPPGTAALAAATILRETYGERVGGNNEPQQIIDQVVAFIDREESRFETDYNPPDLATKARAGWTDQSGIFEFTREGLREATEGFDFHRVLDVLAENGALLIPKGGKRSKVKKVNGRSTRVYPVDSTKLHPPV